MSALDHSLIYASRKIIPEWDEESVDDIVMLSRTRNAALNVTGTLISAGSFFAQVLEGPGDAIEQLMDSIHADARHTDVTVLRMVPIARRSFVEWSMAYSGPSPYLATSIEQLIGCDLAASDAKITRLITMMAGLAFKPEA